MRSYSCEAIILSRRNIGEADKLLTLFTREFGKKVVVAKGIRRAVSKRAPYLELFSHVRILLHRGRTFDIVTEVTSIQPFLLLRKRLERIGFCYIGLELCERLTAENQESVDIFVKLTDFVATLNSRTTDRDLAATSLSQFKRFLLSELGFIDTAEALEEHTLNERIEAILESPLRSPALLTNIQANV